MTNKEMSSVLSQHLLNEVFRVLRQEEEKMGETFTQEVEMIFIASFIGNILYNKLVQKSQEENKYDKTVDAFANLKTKVQEAVAAGFQGAMSKFSNQAVEYYCQIKIVPPVQGTLPN